jgi:predicted 3-demethylubiquinone-9 3-methyltransferase (glyoxalase superfamily)
LEGRTIAAQITGAECDIISDASHLAAIEKPIGNCKIGERFSHEATRLLVVDAQPAVPIEVENLRSPSVWRSAMKPAKNRICLWYDGDAEEAARFYAQTFPDSSVGAVLTAPGDYPSGKKGDVLTVEFIVMGIPCLGLNGGPAFKHNEAFSFQVATSDQVETDRYWHAIVGNGGEESACGWCKDKWSLSWQITPVALTQAIADPDRAAAKRAFDAMMEMTKIDIAAIEAARRG